MQNQERKIPHGITVAICGGGNGAHVAAAYISSKRSVRVNVLTRQPEKWQKNVRLVTAESSWKSLGEIEGNLANVSKDPTDVIPQADVVIVASPSHTHLSTLRQIAPHVPEGCMVGALYAQGGFDWAVKAAFGEKIGSLDCIFGLQNIPWICKAHVYGKACKIFGPKKVLRVAAFPPEKTRMACRVIGMLFDIPATPLPNMLVLTLTPSNQIIHPARYYAIFNEAVKAGVPLPKEKYQKGLYTEVDDLSAEWMCKLDTELQQIRNAIAAKFPQIDLSSVLPLGRRIVEQYGSDVHDTTNLKTIFRTNKGYAGCVTPALEVPGGLLPVVNSRFYWEDIPYGLCILKSLAQMTNIKTASIDFLIEWHQKQMKCQFILDGKLVKDSLKNTGTPEAYGLTTIEQVVEFSIPRKPYSGGRYRL